MLCKSYKNIGVPILTRLTSLNLAAGIPNKRVCNISSMVSACARKTIPSMGYGSPWGCSITLAVIVGVLYLTPTNLQLAPANPSFEEPGLKCAQSFGLEI